MNFFVKGLVLAGFLFFVLPVLANASCGSLASGQYYLLKVLPGDPSLWVNNQTPFINPSFAYVDELFTYSIQGIANRQGPCLYVERNNAWPEGGDYTFNWEKVLADDPDIGVVSGTNFQPVIVQPENIFAKAKDLGVIKYFFWNVETGVSTNNWDWIDVRSSPARMAAFSYAGAKSAIAIPYVKRGGLNNLAVNIKNPSTMINFQTIEELKAYLDALGFSQAQTDWSAFENEVIAYSTGHNEFEVKTHAYNWLVQNWLNNSSFGLSKNYFCSLGIGADDQCVENKAFAFFLNYWPNQPCTLASNQCRIAYSLSNSTSFTDKAKDHEMAEFILLQSSSNATVFGWSNSEPWFAFTNAKFGHVTSQTGGFNFSFISKIPVISPQYLIAPQPSTAYQYDEGKYYSGIMVGDSSYANGAGTMFYDSFSINGSGVGSFTTTTKLNWGIDSAFYDRAPILLAYYFKKARPGLDLIQAGISGDYFFALAVAKFKGMQSLDAILQKNKTRIQNSGMSFFANPWDGFDEGTVDREPPANPNDYGLSQSYYQTNCSFSQQVYTQYYLTLGVKNAFQGADAGFNCISPESPVYTIGTGPSKTTVISRTARADFFGFSPNTTAEFDSKFTTFKNNYNIKTPLMWFTGLIPETSTNPGMTSTKLSQIEQNHPELKFVLLDELYYMANMLYNNEIQNPTFADSATPVWNFSSADASIAASDFADSSGKSLKLNNYSFAFQKPQALTSASGKKFKLTYWAKKTNSNCTPFVTIQELPSWSGKATQYIDSTSWKQYSLIFTLQSNNEHIVTLATANQDAGKGTCALLDDVRLAETNEQSEICSNGINDDGDGLIDCADFTDCPTGTVCGTNKTCNASRQCVDVVRTLADPDLRLYMPFETDVKDYSGNNHDGVLVLGRTINDVVLSDAQRGKVLSVNSSLLNYVKVSNSSSPGNSDFAFGQRQNFTIMFWGKGAAGAQFVLANAYHDTGPGFGAYRDGSYITEGSTDHVAPWDSPPPKLAGSPWLGNVGPGGTPWTWMDSAWHHVVYTVERDQASPQAWVKLSTIIDGGLASTGSRNYSVSYPNGWTPDLDQETINATPIRDLIIGAGYSTGQVAGQNSISFPYFGSLDNVRVYNRLLTLAEIQKIYNEELNLIGPVRSDGTPTGTLPSAAQATISLLTNVPATCKYSTTAGSWDPTKESLDNISPTYHSKLVNVTAGVNTFHIMCQDTSSPAKVNTTDFTISFTVTAPPAPVCGNGAIDAGEQCDGGIGSQTCPGFNSNFVGGSLSCNAAGSPNECTFNTSSCVCSSCAPAVCSHSPLQNGNCCWNTNEIIKDDLDSALAIVNDGWFRFLCHDGQVFVHDGVNEGTIRVSECTVKGPFFAFPNYPDAEWEGGWRSGNGEGIVCDTGKTCQSGACAATPGCTLNSECTTQNPALPKCKTSPLPGECVQCLATPDCGSGYICVSNSCVLNRVGIVQQPKILEIVLDPQAPNTEEKLNVFVKVKNFSASDADLKINAYITGFVSRYDPEHDSKTVPAGESADFRIFGFIYLNMWAIFNEGKVYSIVVKLEKPDGTVLDTAEKQFGLKMQQKSVPEASPILAVVVLVFVLGLVYWKKSEN
ncbi:MAG: hypothetical protein Q7R70_01795 [Candidatus Diapherotrites archaeon]|nr:hypothetical protein [Candidatus Diapherotrites archaeon]